MSLVRFAIWDIQNSCYVKPQKDKMKTSKTINQNLIYLHMTDAQKAVKAYSIQGSVKRFCYKPCAYYKPCDNIDYPCDGYTVMNLDGVYMLDSLRTDYIDFPFFVESEYLNPIYHAAFFKDLEKLKAFLLKHNRILDHTCFKDFKRWTSYVASDEELIAIKNQFHDENIVIVCLQLKELMT